MGDRTNGTQLNVERIKIQLKLTLEIGHVSVDVGVQSVDHHLAVGGAGDLDAAVDQARGRGSSLPCGVLTDVLGLGEEIGQNTPVKLGLADLAALEEGLASVIEGAVQEGEEGEGLGGEDLAVDLVDLAKDGDALKDGFGRGHCDC